MGIRERIDQLRQRIQLASEDDLRDLEREARELLSDAKHTPHETAAQELFAELARQSTQSRAEQVDPAMRGLLRRARIRIEMAGDDDDIDEAIDILTEAIALNPDDGNAIILLQQAAAYHPQAAQRVRDLFSRYGVAADATPQVAPETDETPPPESSAPVIESAIPPDERPLKKTDTEPLPDMPESAPDAPSPTSDTFTGRDDTDSFMRDLTEAYYAGDYQEAIDAANRVLERNPNNATAQDYRQKAEDNLIRGVVPDHRIPFEARVSFNRANSLVRAGNYEEASKLYREARERAENEGIRSWQDVEQALLDIQDLALARELMNEGDRLMATDNWAEAIRKYDGALRVVPNDPQIEDRLENIRSVQQNAEAISVELSMLGGALQDQVEQLQSIRQKLARVRQLLPTSQRLTSIQRDVDERLQGVMTQLFDQAQTALNRAESATVITTKLRLAEEAQRLAENAVELAPGDNDASKLLMEARSRYSDLERSKETIERAAGLVAQNRDGEMAQARALLAEMTTYAQDERYRIVVNDLFSRYLERAEAALQAGDMSLAQTWLDALEDEPFRILGRRSELFRLQNALGQRRTRRRTLAGGIIFIIVIGLSLLAFGTRPQWQAALFPTQTPSQTPTATFTATLTPSATLTPTETFTPSATFTPSNTPTATASPTWTWTPSPTYTPSWTPTASLTPTHTQTPTHTATFTATFTPSNTPTASATPTVTPTEIALCRVFVNDRQGINMRAAPTVDAERLRILSVGTELEVIEQRREEGIWYQVRLTTSEGQEFGWVREDTVEAFDTTPCPTVPTG